MTKQKSLIDTEVGVNIRSLRKKAKLTQGELAGAINLTRPAICNIEIGKQGLTISGLLKICAVLKCKTSDILPKIPTASIKEVIRKTKPVEYKSMDVNFKW